jgi:hypothetical protein
MAKLSSNDVERGKLSFCVTVAVVVTCGVSLVFGGLCYLIYKTMQLNVLLCRYVKGVFRLMFTQKERDQILRTLTDVVAKYSRAWSDLSVQLTVRGCLCLP